MSNRIETPLVEIDLASIGAAESVLKLEELACCGYINVRGKQNDELFNQSVEKVIGLALPVEPNTYKLAESYTALWLGPDEWLIVTPSDQDALALIAELNSAWGNAFATATDVSGGNTMVNVSGTAARDFLAKGSPLDFHPRQFKVGDCAQSVFAHSGALFYLLDDQPNFRLIFRRSFADYLGVWMLDAAREFTD